MFQLEDIARVLLFLGIILFLVAGVLFLVSRLGLGRLPGDIVIQRKNFVFYFPLATSIILSLILTLIFRLLRR
jgi:uncharacterized membrane protein